MTLKSKYADESQLTFSEATVIWGRGVELRNVVLRNTQQRPHEVGEILCTQAASALFVKKLMGQKRRAHLRFAVGNRPKRI